MSPSSNPLCTPPRAEACLQNAGHGLSVDSAKVMRNTRRGCKTASMLRVPGVTHDLSCAPGLSHNELPRRPRHSGTPAFKLSSPSAMGLCNANHPPPFFTTPARQPRSVTPRSCLSPPSPGGNQRPSKAPTSLQGHHSVLDEPPTPGTCKQEKTKLLQSFL